MPLRYETFGPFPFEEEKGQRYKAALPKFWKDRKTEGTPEELPDAIGIYIWTVTDGKRTLPWNVGRTDNQGFKNRFLQKEMGLRNLRDEVKGGAIEIYLLALKTPKDRFHKPTRRKGGLPANRWLEMRLIGSAFSVNPNLRNVSSAKYLKTVTVDGYLKDKPNKRSASAKALNALLTVE